MCENANSINWNKLWMNALTSSKSSYGLKSDEDEIGCAKIWNSADSAAKYDQTARLNNCASAVEKISKMHIEPDYTVLDIGAGPGTLAIPLARRVKKVTAIEPGLGMLECLKDHIRKECIENIVCVNKKWEDVSLDDTEKHDVVIASFSLEMSDLQDALRKMNDFAKQHVYIFWNIGKSDWVTYYEKIWPKVHNRSYIPGPGTNYVYNILYEMGIYANIQVGVLAFRPEYSSLDEAVAVFKAFVHAETQEQENALKKCLPGILVQKKNGAFTLPDNGKYPYALIWWNKRWC